MFLLQRPSAEGIQAFLHESQDLPLSYGPPGIVRDQVTGYRFHEVVVRIGQGAADFARARAALLAWNSSRWD